MKKIVLVLFGIAAFTGVYAVFIERYFVVFREFEFSSEKIPKQFDGMKIAVIADLHYGLLTPRWFVSSIISRVNRYQPDVVVGVGDYVRKKKTRNEIEGVWPELNNLKGKEGVFFVLGNHDHWADTPLSLQKLEESGFSLHHKISYLKRGEERIAIVGLGDLWEDQVGFELLDQIPSTLFRIALAHNPDTADASGGHLIDLMVSGHTHGGQVRVPFIDWAPVIPVKNKNYDSGFVETPEGYPVFISRGLGWSILPIRLFVPPEVAVIVLRHKQ